MNRLPILLIGVALMLTPARALEPAFFSATGAATKNADGQGRHWAYLTWASSRPDQTGGKSFAIYSKPGLPTAPGNFVRQGVVTPVVNATIFAPLLERAEHIGEDLTVLDAMFDDFVDHIDALENAAVRPSIARSLPPANKLASILVKASQHPTLLKGMEDMKAKHPAMGLCLGVAWAGQITDQVTTYELREFNVTANTDVAVIGRITLDWANPVVLPPPGTPVHVTNTKPEGDLNIRLRWATPDNVRRLGPQVQGYHVWRCTWAYAVAHGWDASAPSLVQLNAAVVAGDVKRVSTEYADIVPGNPTPMPSPVMPSAYFSETEAIDFNANPKTYFFADDNRRYDEDAPGTPFADGAEYGYLVTANPLIPQPGEPLLGQGNPSLAGKGIACRTMPPEVPGHLKATPKFTFDGGLGGQHVELAWRANDNTKMVAPPGGGPAFPSSPTTHYEILRSTNIEDFTSDDGGPQLSAIVVSGIAHDLNNEARTFDDTTLNPEAAFIGKTLAYCVRAYRTSPCGNIYSVPSPPVFVSLRDYRGPVAPTGGVEKHCLAPFVGDHHVTANTNSPNDGYFHYRVEITRRDETIKAVSLVAFDHTSLTFVSAGTLANTAFAPHQKVLVHEFKHFRSNVSITAVVSGMDGSISWPYVVSVADQTDASKIIKVALLAGNVSPSAVGTGDPLYPFAYGRIVYPGSVSVNQFSPTSVFATMTPANGLVLNNGALVNVALLGPHKFFAYLATATVSSNTLSFLDVGALGLTQEQLLARYRGYTYDKSIVTLQRIAVLNNNHVRLHVAAADAVNAGTQVCVVKTKPGGYESLGSGTINADGNVVVKDATLNDARTYYAFLFLGPAIPGACSHSPVASGGTGNPIVPVKLNLSFGLDSVEYRIYRRVDDGPLTLIAQDNTIIDEGAAQDVIRSDDSMPAVNCTISYFGQALDKNLNPSPMVLLGRIQIGVSEHTPLPTPLALPPKLLVDNAGNASLDIRWFCAGAGVDRFQVAVLKDNPDPPPPSGFNLNQSQYLFDATTGEKRLFYIAKAQASPRLGTGTFGSGPDFALTIPVTGGDTYHVAIKALGPERFDDEGFSLQSEGEFSQALSIPVPKAPTNTTHTTVAWPFRTLPPVTDGGTIVKAAVLTQTGADLFIGPVSSPAATGVRIGKLPSFSGTGPGPVYLLAANPNNTVDSVPDAAKPNLPVIKALPAVLYRQQIRYVGNTNTERPASEQGALVQCSPLITEIAYSVVQPGNPGEGKIYFTDPAIVGARVSLEERGDLYLTDKLPVISGATYRYWLVHFDDKNEPDRIITAGQVTIPRP